jgi:hypothetical protein
MSARTTACVVIRLLRKSNDFCKTRQCMQQRPLGIASAQPSLPFLPKEFVRGALSRTSLSISHEEDVCRVKVEGHRLTSKVCHNGYGAVTWPQLSSNGTRTMFSPCATVEFVWVTSYA